MADARIALIRDWLANDLGWPRDCRLEPASADASFRRYFRVWQPSGTTRVVMDAPPDKEDVGPYLQVTRLLAACGVHVPEVEAADKARGLLLLEDLGSMHMLARLRSGGDAEQLYGDALAALAQIQLRGGAGARELGTYDAEALEREMRLLPDWFCARHLQCPIDADSAALLQRTFDFLVRELLMQPTVLVHRDYHSRNLMIGGERNPGIIDFQDALAGPVGYDLVSLLKDCYIDWPRARVLDWLEQHRLQLQSAGAGCRRRPRRVPALVRSGRPAAPHQGARHLCAPLVPRRQERLSVRPAAHARIRARRRGALRRTAPTSARGWSATWYRGSQPRMRGQSAVR